MEIKLTIDGKEVKLTEEQIKSFTLKNTVWRAEKGENYECMDERGRIEECEECGDDTDKLIYSIGNCYKPNGAAKAHLALKKHIVDMVNKYGPVKFGEGHLFFAYGDTWVSMASCDKIDFIEERLAGTVMHIDACEGDQAKRTELLLEYFNTNLK